MKKNDFWVMSNGMNPTEFCETRPAVSKIEMGAHPDSLFLSYVNRLPTSTLRKKVSYIISSKVAEC
jgi:hypothetical protein